MILTKMNNKIYEECYPFSENGENFDHYIVIVKEDSNLKLIHQLFTHLTEKIVFCYNISLYHNDIYKSQQIVLQHLIQQKISNEFEINLFDILKDDVQIQSQTLKDVYNFLQTIENYMKGASFDETNDFQKNENLSIYHEAIRLQTQLKHLK